MPKHQNYASYTFDEVIDGLFAVGRSGDEGGGTFDKAWPKTLSELSRKVETAALALEEAAPEIAKSIAYLAGENGAWKGPAAGSFKRTGDGMHQFLLDTHKAAVSPYWSELLSRGANAMDKAQADFWPEQNKGWVLMPGGVDLIIWKDANGQKQSRLIRLPPYHKFFLDKATEAVRPVLANLAAIYQNYGGQFTEPPKSVKYPPGPPPIDPAALVNEANEKNKKDFDDFIAKNNADREKDAAKSAVDLDKLKADGDKALEKAQADGNQAVDKAQADLKDAQKAPDLGAADLEPPGTDIGPGAPGTGNLLTDGGAGPGVPVAGGLDVTGDGVADLDKTGAPLPGFNPNNPANSANIPFTLPGAVPPPGAEIRPPNPPPDGTIVRLDKNGNPVPGSLIVPGQSGGTAPPRGLASLGDLDLPPGSRTPRFVRPPALDADELPRLSTGKLPSSTVDNEFGQKLPRPGGGLGPAEPLNSPASRALRSGGDLPSAGLAGGVRPPVGLGASAGYPPMMPPMGGMGGMGAGGQPSQGGERERQTWLLEDDEIWSDDGDVAPTVLGRLSDGDEDEHPAQF